MKTLLVVLLTTYFLVMRTVLADGLYLAGGPNARSLSFNGGLFDLSKKAKEGDLSIMEDQIDDPAAALLKDIEADYGETGGDVEKRGHGMKPMKRVTGLMGFRRSTKAAWYLGKRSGNAVTPPTVVARSPDVRSHNPFSFKSARWLGLVPYFFRAGTVNRVRP